MVGADKFSQVKEKVGRKGKQKQRLAKIVTLSVIGAGHYPKQAHSQVNSDSRDADGNKKFQYGRREDGHTHHVGGGIVERTAFLRQETVLRLKVIEVDNLRNGLQAVVENGRIFQKQIDVLFVKSLGANPDNDHLHRNNEKRDQQHKTHPFFLKKNNRQQRQTHQQRRNGVGNEKCEIGF